MVGRARARIALALALAALTTPAAQAQVLQRLTVQAFTLSSDVAVAKVDTPFHLEVMLRVRERIGQVYNLNLPMLAELDLLGDERETASGPRGTIYRETITVVAHHPGTLAISPATLQAVDARDGKAKEWYTNALTLQVAGGTPVALRRGVDLLRSAAILALWTLFWLIGIGCVLLIAVLLWRRRPRRAIVAPSPPPPVAPPVPVVQRSRRQQAEDALAVLRAERSRAAAVVVRSAIWRMVGASDGETLGDVLQRPGCSQSPMRELLIALERSAFTYDQDLNAAIDDACFALERSIEGMA
jgi:hypothetical protein